MSTNQPNMSKAQRREAARAEALAVREREQARDKRNRVITLSVLAAALVALAVVVWFILREGDKKNVEDVPLSEVSMPATANDDGGIPVGADGAAGTTNEGAPVVDVYVDYMCPLCGQFEQTNAADIDQLVSGGDVTVVYHPVAILDRVSQGTEYSTRSAAAAAWVADQAPEAFPAFHEQLFTNQPAESSPGLDNEELADLAEQSDVPADVADGIGDGTARTTYGQYVHSATQAANTDESLQNEQGGFGTPTVLIDDERFEAWNQPGALAGAVSGGGQG